MDYNLLTPEVEEIIHIAEDNTEENNTEQISRNYSDTETNRPNLSYPKCSIDER